MVDAQARFRPPRAIFFDMGDTLVYPSPSFEGVTTAVVARHAPELLPLDMLALGAHIEARMLYRRRAGQLVHYPAAAARAFWQATYVEFLADQLPAARADLVADRLLAAFTDLSNWALYHDVAPVLATLRGTGLTLGILSNWEDWLDHLVTALRLRGHFEHILVSGVLGLEKPDPAIFRHALAVAGVAPDELVYVGDSPHHDIEPCQALGIRAILIDRADRHRNVPADHRVTDLRELPGLLGLA